jgi:dihydropteroate synthase
MRLTDLFHNQKPPLIMGIINVAPDSFSGDGKTHTEIALAYAQQMISDGASILDIGGESSRPGATPVSVEEEIARTTPLIAALRRITGMPISIDTTKAAVAAAALDTGASIINDVSGLQADPAMTSLAARRGCPVVLMHNRASGKVVGASHAAPIYENFFTNVLSDLKKLAGQAEAAGIAHDQIILDPGVGFGKTVEQNLALINHTDKIAALDYPVLIGASRKSFIGEILGGAAVGERLMGDAAVCALAVVRGAAILRVHDVKEMTRVVKMTAAILAA